MSRAQANLLALAVALVLVTGAVGVSLAVATGELGTADRDSRARAAASGVAQRLVAADGPLAVRENVLLASRVDTLDAEGLAAAVPATRGRAVRVALDDRVLVPGPTRGATVRRLVLVERRRTVTRTAGLARNETVTLPPTDEATVTLRPPNGTTVTALRADGRVVRRNESGLRGDLVLDLPRDRETTLALNASARLPPGSVRLTVHPWTTRAATLVVSVDG